MVGFISALLLPWRFFRLWEPVDGLDPRYAVWQNNYSALGYCRARHRSHNLRVVHYLVVHLGGTWRLAATNVTFVVFSHDLRPRSLTCGSCCRRSRRGRRSRRRCTCLSGQVMVPSRVGVQRLTDDGCQSGLGSFSASIARAGSRSKAGPSRKHDGLRGK